ncbi:hypothetical protein FEM03_14020 [Phragmitibacter flavus]|uniref:Uncharacterized protein n=1 Tax=Phragmitibacter flavus TaxID=2576071 RepID=A0A5R8KDI3_9BACT|nr:hypothetical protein [Phragmitibacter flavus]TLD70297.1 hypothetical protein FEM03_14020 [Phragmitibacter flavus]
MSRSLNPREKRLLIAVLATLFLTFNFLVIREFTNRRAATSTGLTQLTEQVASNKVWLGDRAFWEKRKAWLDQNMPYTESAGRSQGQLLEDLQTSALDLGLAVTNTTLLEPLALDHANEVGVTLRLRGDQDILLRWLLTLQSPEKFQAIKSIELELDARARETTPQAQCNLTVARWFNPTPPPGQPTPAAEPAPATTPEADPAPTEEEPVNPLDLGSPI